jgi:hypothetical protein
VLFVPSLASGFEYRVAVCPVFGILEHSIAKFYQSLPLSFVTHDLGVWNNISPTINHGCVAGAAFGLALPSARASLTLLSKCLCAPRWRNRLTGDIPAAIRAPAYDFPARKLSKITVRTLEVKTEGRPPNERFVISLSPFITQSYGYIRVRRRIS